MENSCIFDRVMDWMTAKPVKLALDNSILPANSLQPISAEQIAAGFAFCCTDSKHPHRAHTTRQQGGQHSLRGNIDGSRDCHIEPDWVLIYALTKIDADVFVVKS